MTALPISSAAPPPSASPASPSVPAVPADAGSIDLAGLCALAATLTARRRAQRWAWRLLAGALLGVLVGVLSDALLDLPSLLRAGVGLAALGGLIAAILVQQGFGRARLTPSPDEARCLAEAALGDRDRALTASGELAAAGTAASTLASLALRDRLIAAGASPQALAAGLPQVARRPYLLALGAGALLFAGLHVPFPHLSSALLPRLVDPFGGHPPFAMTRLAFVDAPTRARPGDRLSIVVQLHGRAVNGVRVRLAWPDGTQVAEMPLSPQGGDRWGAVLPALPVPPLSSAQRDPPLSLTAHASRVGNANAARSRTVLIHLDPIPVLSGLSLRLVSPVYARLDDAELRVEPGASMAALDALPGSRLRLTPQANRPLAAALLRRDTQPAQRIALDKEGGLWLDDPAPGSWTLIGATADHQSDAMPAFVLTRRIDQPPTVRFASPEGQAVATPDAVIPLAIEARDDLGLTRIVRYRLIDGSKRDEVERTVGGTGDTWRGPLKLDGVVPGQEVVIGALACDSFPPDGQWSAPATLRLRIISGAQWNALVRDQLDAEALLTKYQPLLERIAALEAAASASTAASARSASEAGREAEAQDARQQRLADLARRAAALRQEVRDLRRDDPLFAVEPDIQAALERRLAELEAAAAAGKDPREAAAAEALEDEIAELTARATLDALGEALADLAAEQERIAAELRDLASRPTPSAADRARLRAAAADQAALREDLAAWNALAAQAAEQLSARDPEGAEKIRALAKQVATADAPMAESRSAAERSQAASAAPPASEAARILRQQAGKCQGGACKGGQCSGSALGQCQAQLAKIAKAAFNAKRSRSGTGNGMTGSSGSGLHVAPGGRPSGAPARMPLFGPEPIASRSASSQQGGQAAKGEEPGAVLGADGKLHPAPPHQRAVRRTTAGASAPLSPSEERLLDDYYRRLAGDALSPSAHDLPTPGAPQ